MKNTFHQFVWILLIVVSAMVLFPKMNQNALVDFRSAWSAARLLCHGENPYDDHRLLVIERAAGWSKAEAVIPWNPPWAIAIFVPFTFLPFSYAKWIWIAFNGFLILFIGDYWWKTYGGKAQYRPASWLAALWFFPCIVALYFGQMSLIVLAGVTGIAWSIKRDKIQYLGIFILLASLKPHLLIPLWIILLLWIARRSQWKAWMWAGSGVVVAGLAATCLRPEIYQDYIRGAVSVQGPVIWATPTIGTALRIAFPDIPNWVVFLPTVGGVFLSLFFWRRWKAVFSWERHLDLILLLSLASASYVWIFDWAILFPVVIRILVWFQLDPRRQWSALTALLCAMAIFVWAQARGLFPLGVIWFPFALATVYLWARWLEAVREDSIEFKHQRPSFK